MDGDVHTDIYIDEPISGLFYSSHIYTRNINLYTMYNVFWVQAIHLKKG